MGHYKCWFNVRSLDDEIPIVLIRVKLKHGGGDNIMKTFRLMCSIILTNLNLQIQVRKPQKWKSSHMHMIG